MVSLGKTFLKHFCFYFFPMRRSEKKFIKLLIGLALLLLLHLTITIYQLISYFSDNQLRSSNPTIKMRFFAIPKTFPNYKKNPSNLIIYVKSSLKNLKGRKAVRRTWGLTASLLKIPVVFAVGTGSPAAHQKLNEEIAAHGDIFWANFTDSRRNSALKTLSILLFHQNFNSKFQYVFLTDDDLLVLVKNLQKIICDFEVKNISNVVAGNCSTDDNRSHPIRDPKDKKYQIVISKNFYCLTLSLRSHSQKSISFLTPFSNFVSKLLNYSLILQSPCQITIQPRDISYAMLASSRQSLSVSLTP